VSALSLRLPNSLHERARELAEREGISINQLISTALAEKMAALMTEEFLEARARRGSRSRFLRALTKVPEVAPDPGDELPVLSRARKPAEIASLWLATLLRSPHCGAVRRSCSAQRLRPTLVAEMRESGFSFAVFRASPQ